MQMRAFTQARGMSCREKVCRVLESVSVSGNLRLGNKSYEVLEIRSGAAPAVQGGRSSDKRASKEHAPPRMKPVSECTNTSHDLGWLNGWHHEEELQCIG